MDFKEIMSVSGQPGLFRFVSQGRNGIIVESFADKKRSFVSASQKVSSLADIAIFTDGDEVPLKDVFKNIHDLGSGIAIPDSKSSPEALKKFLEKVLPAYNRDKVYVSDIKKLVTWYNALLELNLLDFEEKEEKVEEKSETPAPEPVLKGEKAVKPKTKVKTEDKAESKVAPAKAKKTTAAKNTAENKKK
jgi:hypothetical protein